MNSRLWMLAMAIVAFGALTAVALAEVGYWGIIKPHFESWGAGQVLADLTIMGLLACLWMWKDARERGGNAWPFVLLTLAAGSFGPLLYLVLRELRGSTGLR